MTFFILILHFCGDCDSPGDNIRLSANTDFIRNGQFEPLKGKKKSVGVNAIKNAAVIFEWAQ